MSLLPLALGVGQASDTGNGGSKPPSKAKIEKILEHDDFTCRFCGFRSAQYQRVIPFRKDFVTSCIFCEQVLNLERAGLMGSGILIWLPEISQAELHHIVRAIYVALADDDTTMAASAQKALNALMSRKTEAKKRLGSDDPLLLSAVLHENLSEKERVAAQAKLEGIRLLPLDRHMVRSTAGEINGFPRIVKFWRSERGPFGNTPPQDWGSLLERLAGEA